MCHKADDHGAQGCRVHPTFRRLIVLPHSLEFVLADTFDDDRIKLYTALGTLLHHLPDPPADLPSNFCGDVGTREDGNVIFFQRFNLDIDSLPSSGCAPCGN